MFAFAVHAGGVTAVMNRAPASEPQQAAAAAAAARAAGIASISGRPAAAPAPTANAPAASAPATASRPTGRFRYFQMAAAHSAKSYQSCS